MEDREAENDSLERQRKRDGKAGEEGYGDRGRDVGEGWHSKR